MAKSKPRKLKLLINGEWVDPVILADGQTWAVHIQKPTMYGPVHVEVTT